MGGAPESLVEALAVYCADVGSIKQGNFGWAREELPVREIERHRGGTEIVELVEAVADHLSVGVPVALGFECPLFVPVPEDSFRLGAARPGEGTRPWSAGAGTGALATGLVQAAWVLAELRKWRPDDQAYLNWAEFMTARAGLFLGKRSSPPRRRRRRTSTTRPSPWCASLPASGPEERKRRHR